VFTTEDFSENGTCQQPKVTITNREQYYLQCSDAVGWAAGKVECWHGYLSGARCRFAYVKKLSGDVHRAQLIPLPLTISCSKESRLVLVLPFWYWLTWVVKMVVVVLRILVYYLRRLGERLCQKTVKHVN